MSKSSLPPRVQSALLCFALLFGQSPAQLDAPIYLHHSGVNAALSTNRWAKPSPGSGYGFFHIAVTLPTFAIHLPIEG